MTFTKERWWRSRVRNVAQPRIFAVAFPFCLGCSDSKIVGNGTTVIFVRNRTENGIAGARIKRENDFICPYNYEFIDSLQGLSDGRSRCSSLLQVGLQEFAIFQFSLASPHNEPQVTVLQDIQRDDLGDERRGLVALNEAACADHAPEHPRHEDARGDALRPRSYLPSDAGNASRWYYVGPTEPAF